MDPFTTAFDQLPVAGGLVELDGTMGFCGYTDAVRGLAGDNEPDAFLEQPFTAKQMDEAVDAVLVR